MYFTLKIDVNRFFSSNKTLNQSSLWSSKVAQNLSNFDRAAFAPNDTRKENSENDLQKKKKEITSSENEIVTIDRSLIRIENIMG